MWVKKQKPLRFGQIKLTKAFVNVNSIYFNEFQYLKLFTCEYCLNVNVQYILTNKTKLLNSMQVYFRLRYELFVFYKFLWDLYNVDKAPLSLILMSQNGIIHDYCFHTITSVVDKYQVLNLTKGF